MLLLLLVGATAGAPPAPSPGRPGLSTGRNRALRLVRPEPDATITDDDEALVVLLLGMAEATEMDR